MTVYENAAYFMKKEGKMKTAGFWHTDEGVVREDFDTEDIDGMRNLQNIANAKNASVYVIREFIANDALYQEKRPDQLDKDWFVFEIKPTS